MASLILLLVGIFCFALCILAFFKPKYALFFLLVLRPVLDHFGPLRTILLPILGISGLQTIGVALPFVLIFACLLKKLDVAHRDVFFFRDRLTNYYLIFVVSCIPALLLSLNIIPHAGDWLKFLTFWAVCIFAQNFLETAEDSKQVMLWIIIGSLYPLAMFFFDFATLNTVRIGGLVRILGGYYDEKGKFIFAADLLICFVPAYLYYLAVIKQTIWQRICFLGFCFLIVCIAATNFRTIIVATLLMCLCFLFFRKKYITVLTMFTLTVCAIIVVPALRAKFSPVLDSLLHINDIIGARRTIYDPLLSTRFGIYRTLINTMAERFSPGNFIAGYGYNLPLKSFWVDSAHMEFLQLIFRYGLPSAILFYGFLLATIRRGIRFREDAFCQVITSFVIGLCLISLMGNPFSNVRVLWYLGVYVAILSKRSCRGGSCERQHCG